MLVLEAQPGLVTCRNDPGWPAPTEPTHLLAPWGHRLFDRVSATDDSRVSDHVLGPTGAEEPASADQAPRNRFGTSSSMATSLARCKL